MQKVQICMTERVLNLIQLQGLKLSLSDIEVWYQLSEHINFEFDRFKARVGNINVHGSSLPMSVSGCITSFQSFIYMQDNHMLQVSIMLQKTM